VASSVGFSPSRFGAQAIYSNPEAIRILTFRLSLEIRGLSKPFSPKGSGSFSGSIAPLHSDSLFEFVSGRRRYLCRVINCLRPQVALRNSRSLLLERKALSAGLPRRQAI